MNKRLSEIIKYKTGGKQAHFALIMGWSPQYLSKLIHGIDFGLAPVIAVLQKCPEINARWLLLGEGAMLNDEKLNDLRVNAQSYVTYILDMEKYLPVMSPSEISHFEAVCVGKATPDFNLEAVARWSELLASRQEAVNAKFKEALCRQKKAKK